MVKSKTEINCYNPCYNSNLQVRLLKKKKKITSHSRSLFMGSRMFHFWPICMWTPIIVLQQRHFVVLFHEVHIIQYYGNSSYPTNLYCRTVWPVWLFFFSCCLENKNLVTFNDILKHFPLKQASSTSIQMQLFKLKKFWYISFLGTHLYVHCYSLALQE